MAADIDVLVVCSNDCHADRVRERVVNTRLAKPLDVYILTAEEEAEVSFVLRQGCLKFSRQRQLGLIMTIEKVNPTDEENPAWVAERLGAAEDVVSVKLQSAGLLDVQRKRRKSFRLAVLATKDVVTEAEVALLFGEDERPQFVVNVPANAIWEGNLIHRSRAAFGGMEDLFSANRLNTVSTYRNKGLQFVEDGLSQMYSVSNVTRIYDRLYSVSHVRLGELRIAVIEAYKLSAEHVRGAFKRYGAFNVALKLSPYGGITTAARNAAKSVRAEACMWDDLLEKLLLDDHGRWY